MKGEEGDEGGKDTGDRKKKRITGGRNAERKKREGRIGKRRKGEEGIGGK